ncbi:MAG: hypothetical protein OJF61_002330 [Rhodanobacteraceae bacterium]|nr:MAG: hypothetical protein OJF61_002330 [Rhodanobacteraceae bacterium]
MMRDRSVGGRKRHLAKGVLHGVIALAAFIALFYWVGDLGNLSMHRPFEYSGDALEKLAYQAHDYVANDFDIRMRAPFELAHSERGQYVYNALFQSDSNLIWIAKLIGGNGAAKTLNLAYLLSFLLVFGSGYWAYGRLGLRDPFRFGAASLFALMPYHFQRAENHLLESMYYFVPLMILLMLSLWSARPLACRWNGDRWQFTWRDSRLWGALLLLTFLTSFNPYQQFFFACLVASVAPFAAACRKSWRPLLAGWGLAVFACAVLVFKHVLAHHLAAPDLALGLNNQSISDYGGAERYPLKIAQMLLPVQGHRWSVLASLRHMYDVANPLNNENNTTTLGFIGGVGFLSCIAFALSPVAKMRLGRAGKLGLIVLMAVLFASMGGFSSLISTASAVVLGPGSLLTQARGWDRIIVFIGFSAYFTTFWLLQRCVSVIAFVGWRRFALIWFAGAAVFAFALWDQVPYTVTQQRDGHFRSDKIFFGTLQKRLPAGSRIFQLPFVVHHYSGFVLPGVYYTEMLRPYVNTRNLHFTYGGDRLSVQAQWLRAASALPADQAADYLCRYGFAGVLLQLNMLKDPATLAEQWQVALGTAPTVSEDGDYAFFPLGSFCASRGIQRIKMDSMKAKSLEELKQGLQFLPGGAFEHLTGRVLLTPADRIVINADQNEQGNIAYGPYETLDPGPYQAVFSFANISNDDEHRGALTIDVTVQTFGKEHVLTSATFQPASGTGPLQTRLEFVIGRNDTNVQYRVVKTAGFGVEFLGVDIQRLSR